MRVCGIERVRLHADLTILAKLCCALAGAGRIARRRLSVRDTAHTMTEESTTPDLVELGSRALEAGNRGDLDAVMSFYAPDAVVENADGLGTFEGKAAIRDLWQDWLASFEELWVEPEEVLDLGHGLVFSVFLVRGRPVGSGGEVRQRTGGVTELANGLIVRVTFYTDIDNARAAAQRLAQERG